MLLATRFELCGLGKRHTYLSVSKGLVCGCHDCGWSGWLAAADGDFNACVRSDDRGLLAREIACQTPHVASSCPYCTHSNPELLGQVTRRRFARDFRACLAAREQPAGPPPPDLQPAGLSRPPLLANPLFLSSHQQPPLPHLTVSPACSSSSTRHHL